MIALFDTIIIIILLDSHTFAFIVSSRWDTSRNSQKKIITYKSRNSVKPPGWNSWELSYIDANSEQQKEDSKVHEERGQQGDEELFIDIPSVLSGGNLINKEPGSK